MRAINVAITINLQADPHQNIFFNGANQHCFFLYQLLKQVPFVKNVWLAGNVKGKDASPSMMLGDVADDVQPLNDIIYEVDLLIIMNSGVGQDHAAVITGRGGRIVNYKFGNELFLFMESICFGGHKGLLPNPDRIAFDEVWANPQHRKSCGSFYGHLYGAPVHVVPHLWSPYFVEKYVERFPSIQGLWGYRNRGKAKTVGVFEPNLSVVKNVLIPMYAINAAWRLRKDLITRAHLTNTHDLIDHPLFSHLALGCEVCSSHVAVIERRFPTVHFMAENVDLVVAHQIENGQNYLYYEALSGNYPLVHNSPELRECGYYYEGFDIDGAARCIIEAIETHDSTLRAYEARSRRYLDTIDPFNAQVRAAYETRILALFG